MQIAEAETKKYDEVQQSEQSAFQASIADLNQAVASMQSYTDMSAAAAVAEEVRFHQCTQRMFCASAKTLTQYAHNVLARDDLQNRAFAICLVVRRHSCKASRSLYTPACC